MTAASKMSPPLDDVLDEIASYATVPSAQQLRELTAKYPQFEKEIVDFVTDLAALEMAPTEDEISVGDAQGIVDRTMSRVNQMLFDSKKSAVLTDLYADIKASGHDSDSFRRLIGIDLSILDCVARRLVRPSSVPRRLVEAIAFALNRELSMVREFLLMPPVAATAYKSRNKPQVQQMGFKDLVEHSDLTDVEKRRWLDEEADGDERG